MHGHVLAAAPRPASPSRPHDSQSMNKTVNIHRAVTLQDSQTRQSLHKTVYTTVKKGSVLAAAPSPVSPSHPHDSQSIHRTVTSQGGQFTKSRRLTRQSIHKPVTRTCCGAAPGIAIPARGPPTRQSLHKAFSPQDSHFTRQFTRQSSSTRHKAVNPQDSQVNARARTCCGAAPGIAISPTRQSVNEQDSQYPQGSHLTR